MRRLFALVLILGAVCFRAAGLAQQSVSLTLRSGEVLSGELLDLGGAGFTIRLPDGMRQIHEDQVTIVAFTDRGGISQAELERLRTSRHVIVLRTGVLVGGRVMGISGTSPLRVMVESDGGRREYSSTEVACILLASPAAYSAPASTSTTGGTPASSFTMPPAPASSAASTTKPQPESPPASAIPLFDPSAGQPTSAPPARPDCNPALFAATWEGDGSWGDVALQPAGECRLTGTYSAGGSGTIDGVITGDLFRFSWRRTGTTTAGEAWLRMSDLMKVSGRWCNGIGCDSTNGVVTNMNRKGPPPQTTAAAGGQASSGTGTNAGTSGYGINIPLGKGATLGIGLSLPGAPGTPSTNAPAQGQVQGACDVRPFITTWTGSPSWGDMTLFSPGDCRVSGTYTYPSTNGGQVTGSVSGGMYRFHWKANSGGAEGEAAFIVNSAKAQGTWCSGTGCNAAGGNAFEMVRK